MIATLEEGEEWVIVGKKILTSPMTRTYSRGITVPKDDAEGSSKCGWEAPSPHWTRFAHSHGWLGGGDP